MIIDTHAHLNFKAFNQDREKVIQQCLSNKIFIINVGSNYLTSKQAVKMSREGVYAAVGLHPIHVEKEEFDLEKYQKLASNKYVKAIGETGFDFLKSKDLEKQKQVFKKHLRLSKELNLPLIIHCRKAHKELLEFLPEKVNGVVHCFTGSLSQAREYLAKDLFLGFNGIIFKLNLDKIIREVPLEKMLAETDCPYLGEKERNDPFFTKKIIEKIAKIKGLEYHYAKEVLNNNAKKLFYI